MVLSSTEASDARTPLSSGELCIKAQNGGCRPRDGANLVLTKETDCEKKEMEFTLSADGLLRHACSNALVCPKDSKNTANTLLVVSRKCSNSQAKFERTKGKNFSLSSLPIWMRIWIGLTGVNSLTSSGWQQCRLLVRHWLLFICRGISEARCQWNVRPSFEWCSARRDKMVHLPWMRQRKTTYWLYETR